MNIDWDAIERAAFAPKVKVVAPVAPKPQRVRVVKETKVKRPRYGKCWCGTTISKVARVCRIHFWHPAALLLFAWPCFAADPISVNTMPIAPVAPVTPPTAAITLAWDPSASTSAAGYRVYWGQQSGLYNNTATVGNLTNATITGLLLGTKYYFAATAYTASGEESNFSNEVGVTAGYETVVTITSRRAASPAGPWTNAMVVWRATNSPLPALYVDHLVERTTSVHWR